MPEPKSIIFHVGIPKTGTTSLQTWLSAHEEDVAACGVRYLKSFRRGPSHNYLTRLAVQGDKDEFLTRKISQEIAECPEQRILISSETAYGAVKTPKVLNVFTPEMLENCEVFFYFRRQDLFLEAMAKQKFKGGDRETTLSELKAFIKKRRNRAAYLAHIKYILESFPGLKLSCKPFDRSVLEGGDVITDFWKLLSLPKSKRPPLPKGEGNMTPSVELLHALTQQPFSSPVMRRGTINHLIRTHPELFRSKDILTNAERQALMNGFRRENEELSKFCGHDLVALFHEDVDYSSESKAMEDPQTLSEKLKSAEEIVAKAATKVQEDAQNAASAE